MSGGHTTGPWTLGQNFTEHGFTDNDGGIPIIGNSADEDSRQRIATALLTKHMPRGKTYKAADPERDANAHLIAAAPDLDAAAGLAITALGFEQEKALNARDQAAYAQITAAKNALIAAQDKARGREPKMLDVTPHTPAIAKATP